MIGKLISHLQQNCYYYSSNQIIEPLKRIQILFIKINLGSKFNSAIIIISLGMHCKEVFRQELSEDGNPQDKMPQAIRKSFVYKELIVHSLSLSDQIPRPIGIMCQLCMILYRQDGMRCMGSCNHKFCRGCLHKYLIYKISVMEEAICPQEECEATLDTNTVCFRELPEESKKRYDRFLLWKQTISNPNLHMCPTDGCTGLINKRQSSFCKTCKTEFCWECMMAKHEGTCEDNFQLIFENFKRCPSCRIFIEKDKGCGHMTCRCKYQFCFVCLKEWKTHDKNKCYPPVRLPAPPRPAPPPRVRASQVPRPLLQCNWQKFYYDSPRPFRMILAFFMIIMAPIVIGVLILALALWKSLKILKLIYGLMWADASFCGRCFLPILFIIYFPIILLISLSINIDRECSGYYYESYFETINALQGENI